MSCGQHARILHMTLEVPELFQSHARDIYDVRRADDWGFRIRSGKGRTDGQHKSGHVLVQRKDAEQSWRNLGGIVSRGCCFRGCAGRVCSHVFAVEIFNLEDINRNTSAVTTAGPLRIL